MVINIPNRVCSDKIGFEWLVRTANELNNISFSTITFDFRFCSWFEANLCAVLGAICHRATQNINNVEFVNLSPSVQSIFSKNEFLKHFGSHWVFFDLNKTTIKYRRYKSNEQSLFKKYLDDELLSMEDMPNMSELLRKKINESIFEIFENAVTHGASEYVFSCGQYYPQKNPPRIDFTIVDLGKGIKSNVNEYLGKSLKGSKTIEWAVEERNTTKKGNTPGGLGLKLIREFLKINKGEIQIVSVDGFWQQDKNNIIFAGDFNKDFAGTIVNLEFNIDKKNIYFFTEEANKLKEKDIF
jgi:hypothetical protein